MKNMHISLRAKFLGIMIILVFVTTAAMSGTYYALMKRDKHRDSKQRIAIAFNTVLQEFEKNRLNYAKKLQEFLNEDVTLALIASSYLDDPAQIASVSFFNSYLKEMPKTLQRFGRHISINRLSVYAADHRLLAAYQQEGGAQSVGVFIKTADGKDTYLATDDFNALRSILFSETPVPLKQLPDGIAPYCDAMPNALTSDIFRQGRRFGFYVSVPIFRRQKLVGLLVGELFYTQEDADWYAALTKTDVNLFIEHAWLLGTSPRLQPASEADDLMRCGAWIDKTRDISVASLRVDGQDYYQGSCAFANAQGVLGVLTVSMSRAAEQQELSRMLMNIVSVAAAAALFSVLLSALLSRHVTRSISQIGALLNAVAEGDLRNAAISISRDELGGLILCVNRMIADLRAIVLLVKEAEAQVSSATEELSASIKAQGKSMMRQVDSANHVAAAVEAISSVSDVLGKSLQHVSDMAQETAEYANQGQSNLSRMEKVNQHIGKASATISEKLAIIHAKAESITSVVTTMTSVADQTNLLSLNAAIEAEKAGESGRGFAVVAREIRRLADQSAVATLDIEDMVSAMQTAVAEGIGEVDRFILEVRQSAEDVSHIGTQLARIIEQVQTLLPNFDDINVAMGHQTDYAEQIHHAILALSEQVQETMDSLHCSFEVVARVDNAAKGLQNEVSRFKVS